MDDATLLKIHKRAKAYAYKLCRNLEDAEDYAQLAVIEAIERTKRHVARVEASGTNSSTAAPHFKVAYLVLEAIRRECGRGGSDRSKLFYALRNSKRIVSELSDDEPSNRYRVAEEHLSGSEPSRDGSNDRVDLELAERVGGLPEYDETCLIEANRRGVAESRVSQLRTAAREKFVMNYMWEHYKENGQENGLETELEVDWITL